MDKTFTPFTMKTHCVGRFLVDLPADFEQHAGSDLELIYGLDKNSRKVKVEIVRTEDSQPSFKMITSTRAADLASQQHFEAPSKSMLVSNKKITEHVASLISYESPDMLEYMKVEVFAEKNSAVALFRSDIFKNDVPEDIEAMTEKVADQSISIASHAQAGGGTCFGSLVIAANQDGEIFNLAFRSKSLPDVVIQIDMNSILQESDGGLLKRWDSKTGLLSKLDFSSTTLRRGQVTVGGLPGEELLSTGKEQGHIVRGFTAEAFLTKPATFAKPSLAISMNMGGQLNDGEYRDASLSERDALTLWDAIVKSVRPRPDAN